LAFFFLMIGLGLNLNLHFKCSSNPMIGLQVAKQNFWMGRKHKHKWLSGGNSTQIPNEACIGCTVAGFATSPQTC
jgi:hypothetical protein